MANPGFPVDKNVFEEDEEVMEDEMENEEVSDEEIAEEEISNGKVSDEEITDEEDSSEGMSDEEYPAYYKKYKKYEKAVFKLKLLKLPANVIKNVLHNMDIIEIIAYSLCSKSTKQQIVDMKLEVHSVRKSIDETLSMFMILDGKGELTVRFSNDNRWEESYEMINFEFVDPRFVALQWRDEELGEVTCVEWYNEHTYYEWLEHFSNLFVCNENELLRFYKNSERFNIVYLHKPFRDTDNYILLIDGSCSDMHRDQLLQRFQPIKRFHLNGPLFSTLREHHRFIFGNFDLIWLHDEEDMGLDEVLLCNSLQVRVVESPEITVKEVNRFFKLWIRGGNRRLRYFSIVLPQGLVPDENALLKGIKYQVLPEDREELFEIGVYIHEVNGGIEIYSKAGRRANIQLSEEDGQHEIEIIVWP